MNNGWYVRHTEQLQQLFTGRCVNRGLFWKSAETLCRCWTCNSPN